MQVGKWNKQETKYERGSNWPLCLKVKQRGDYNWRLRLPGLSSPWCV